MTHHARSSWSWIATLGVALVTGVGAGPAAAQISGERFASQQWGIRISAPAGWRMNAQSSYPTVLLWMYRSNPSGKMLLSAERLTEPTTSEQYTKQTRQRLQELGYQVQNPQKHSARDAFWIDFNDGNTFSRQALMVIGDTGLSLTLAAPNSQIRAQYLRAFDYALRALEPLTADSDAATPAQGASAAPIADDQCALAPAKTP